MLPRVTDTSPVIVTPIAEAIVCAFWDASFPASVSADCPAWWNRFCRGGELDTVELVRSGRDCCIDDLPDLRSELTNALARR